MTFDAARLLRAAAYKVLCQQFLPRVVLPLRRLRYHNISVRPSDCHGPVLYQTRTA